MSDDTVRDLVSSLFEKIGQGAAPAEIASLFSEDVDWFIAGDTENVPWIGRKAGRKGVAEFFRQIRELIAPERFEVSDVLVKGSRAVVLGTLASRARSTGKLMETEFAFDLTVKNGLIVRYRMFEDSFAVARAVVP
ncbi:nuclear transport factor 2 family protein [Pseudothauera rhizosphaerae]|uniref:Nuclear transport factor 2 family protein n=1 Tax=Pseudothauera rhizosphaerae TaxID=2565932 RepID=A0A4S4AQU6_9RHOO|nr:nuclear transport factor 2 family protein [Pseudothauera rhizosphaerae]THF62142.1 nuclear transport factor 2 family protein [Pseudothauera rhizosphaerae]